MLLVMLRRCFLLGWAVGLVGMWACSSEPDQRVRRNGLPFKIANSNVEVRILSDTALIDSTKTERYIGLWEGEDYILKVAVRGLTDSVVSLFLHDSTFQGNDGRVPFMFFGEPSRSGRSKQWTRYEGIISCRFTFGERDWFARISRHTPPAVFYLPYYSSFRKRDSVEHVQMERRWYPPNWRSDSLLLRLTYTVKSPTEGLNASVKEENQSFREEQVHFIIAVDSATGKHTYAPARPLDKY